MTKLTLLLILIACLQAHSNGYAQGNITMFKKQAPLQKIFKEIKRQTGNLFVYRDEWLSKALPVNIQVTNAPLDEVLKICLEGQPLTYVIIGRTIVLKPKEEKPVQLTNGTLMVSPIDVRGRVLNEKGEPASGVTVTVKGTSVATSTNENGEFSLSTVDDNAILVFTSVNLETFEVKVDGRQDLVVNLKAKITALEDVTVTYNTGYEKIPKERATGSFQHVNNEELNRKVGPDLLSRLEGVTTGILFDRRSSSPNRTEINSLNVQIRGISTLTTLMTSPLIVLNNFPYEGDINSLNPNDIESISILKDAAASSIWGAKAANGVIVITTKDGTYNKKPQVTLNSNFNYIERPDLFHYTKMTSSEFIDVETFLFDKGFYNSNISNASNFPALTPVVDILAKRRVNQISASDSASMLNILRNTDVRNDFNNYFYRSVTSQQYSLNVTGGSQTVKYVFSGGLDKTPDVLVGNSRTRATFFTNTTFKLTDRFNINLGINHASTNYTANSIGNIGSVAYDYRNGRRLYSYARLANDQGNALATVKDYRAAYTDTAGSGRLLDWKYRPLDELNNADNSEKQQETLLKLGINYNLSNSVEIQGNYQYLFGNGEKRNYYSDQTYLARNLVNLYTQIQGNNIIRIIPASGILDLTTTQLKSHSGRVQLNYNKIISGKHELSGIAGGEIRERINTLYADRTYGYNENILSSAPIDYNTNYTLYGGNRGTAKIPYSKEIRKYTDHFISVFGNLAYTFDKRYTLTISARRDASNLFGVNTNDKWSPFWTVGGAWNVANEMFYKLSALPTLKLRGSYGYVGNVNNTIAPYTILNYATTNSSINGLPYASIGIPANPGLTWETLRELNIGLDYGLRNKRISGSFDFYEKRSNNLIYLAMIDPTSGINNVNMNSATMAGRGFEWLIRSINMQTKSFRWTSEFGLSKITNKILDYKQDEKGLTIEQAAKSDGLFISKFRGRSPYPIFSFPFAGLDAAGNPQGYDGKALSTDYQKIFNQKFDTANLIYHGSAVPTIFGFINNIVSYRGISLLVNINYSFGYYFKKSTISYYQLFNSGVGHYDYTNRWQKAGDEGITTIPSMVYPLSNSRRDDFFANSSVNVLKGDNIRLQSIKTSYTLSKKLSDKMRIQALQLYAVANNIGIIWRANKEGLDPDIDGGNAPYPRPRTIAFGVNVTF